MSRIDVGVMLSSLASGGSSDAWRQFVVQYSALIFRMVNRYEVDDDRRSECFLFVCAALSDDGFRRLRSYQVDGAARFETWLKVVVANLCIDWRRKEDGRRRLPVNIQALSELEREVFHAIFVRGASRYMCLRWLQARFPDLTEARLSEINAQLFKKMSPRQRFLLAAGNHRGRLQDLAPEESMTESEHSGSSDPFDLVTAARDEEQLGRALASLPAGDRLLLALRYEQGLTLAEVARLTGNKDPFRAQRQINRALHALRLAMEQAHDSREAHPQNVLQCP